MYLRSFFRELADLRQYVIDVHDKSLAMVYKSVLSFVLDCNYSSVRSAPIVVSMITGGASTKDIALRLGITESTVRDKVGSVSRELYELFGKDFFEKFKSGNADEVTICENRLYTAVNSCRSSSYYVLDELKLHTNYAPKQSYEGILYEDCKSEIAFLLKYNKPSLVDDLNKLSKQKLNYLISLLDGKGEEEDRYALFLALNRGCK